MKNLREVYQQVRQINLTEEITRKELAPMLDAFVSFASDKLGIKSLPNIRYKNDEDDYNSFAAYNPSQNELSISTLNRHPMDIFRSVAHELVHHKQNEDGRIGKDIAKEGSTGSDIENEANSEAGKIMRWFAKANPNMFTKTHVVESTNSTAAGIRGLGNVTGDPKSADQSSNYLKTNTSFVNKDVGSLVQSHINMHDIPNADRPSDRLLRSTKHVKSTLSEGVNDPGRLKAVFLAGGPGSGKDFVLKKSLTGNGLRELNSDQAFEHLMRRHGLNMQMPRDEESKREVLRGKAKEINDKKEVQSLSGRLGHIINSTADNFDHIKAVKDELEDLGYDTSMVFVNTSDDVSRQRNIARGMKGERKVPDGTDANGVPDGSPDIRGQKWLRAQQNHDRFRELFGNKFTSIDNTEDINKATPERRKELEAEFDRVRRHVSNFTLSPVENERGNQWIKSRTRYTGIRQYTPPKAYKRPPVSKPVEQPKAIVKPDENLMNQARSMGLSYYGGGEFGRKVSGQRKTLFVKKGNKLERNEPMTEEKKMKNPCWKGYEAYGTKKKKGKTVPNCVPMKEDVNASFEEYMKTPANREVGTNSLTDIYRKMTPGQEPGATAPVKKVVAQEDAGLPKGAFDLGSMNDGLGPTFSLRASPAVVAGFAQIGSTVAESSPSIREWALKEDTQAKFFRKYGENAVTKLLEACKKLEEAGCGCTASKPKSIRKLRESFDKGILDMKPIGTGMLRPHMEVDEDWQKVNRKDKTDGLSQKAVDAYRRENPGSKLQTAVTEKNPSGKRKKRRKSFCRRMKGMKNKLTSSKTANDPDSNINKALRRWNCEE